MKETKDALVIVAILCRSCDVSYVAKLDAVAKGIRCEQCNRILVET